MLCQVCWWMLRWQVGKQWRDANGLYFNHHDSIRTLEKSHEMGCGICGLLYKELIVVLKKYLRLEYGCDDSQSPNQLDNDADTTHLSTTELSAHSTALLGVIHEIKDEDVFRLDFTVEWVWRGQNQDLMKRTFVLKEHGVENFA